MFRKYHYIIILLVFTSINCLCSQDTNFHFKNRRRNAWIGLSTLTVGTHALLYNTWYSKETRHSFHWVNDNKSWLQMDKAGHVFGAYFSAAAASAAFRYSGYNRKKSALLGMGFSLAFQMPIEYFDGKSNHWGASSGDIVANAAGSLFAGIQNWHWGNTRIPVRFTFRLSPFATIRPDMLGSNTPTRMLKDYNGQTYWLDFNPERMRVRPGFWPRWLGINFGYGADGLLGGDDNIWRESDGRIQDYSNISRNRQYYIGPSLSFGYLKKHPKKAVRILANITDKVRLPLPVLEFTGKNSVTFRPIYW